MGAQRGQSRHIQFIAHPHLHGRHKRLGVSHRRLALTAAVLETDDALGVGAQQLGNDRWAQAHTGHLRDVIEHHPQRQIEAGVKYRSVSVHHPVVAHALEKKRGQHQATMHTACGGVARQRHRVGQRGATGVHQYVPRGQALIDQDLQRVHAFGHRKRWPLASGAKQRHT